jgi:hypothetical protein
MSEPLQPQWIDDPNVVVFVTSQDALAVGAVERQGLREAFGNLFGRATEDVKADFARTFDQMRSFLEGLSPSAHGYEVDEIAFQLGFSALGRVAFIAEAGITSSITVTFKRAPETEPSTEPTPP